METAGEQKSSEQEKIVQVDRFKKFISVIQKNEKLIFLSAVIFAASFLFYYYPVWQFGYAPGVIDAEDHSFSIKLFTGDPLFFFESLFSFNRICSPYHAECRIFAVNTNPPFFYLTGGIFSLFSFAIKDVNVGYFTAAVMTALASVLVFLFSYKITRNFLLSFFPPLAFGINLMLFQTLHQGLYLAAAGLFLFILSIYYFYKSLTSFAYKNLVLSVFLLSMTSPYYLTSLLVSFISFFIISLANRSFLFNYLKNLFNFFKTRKRYIILFFVSAFYLFRIFNVFSGLVASPQPISFDEATKNLFNSDLTTLLSLLPKYFLIFLISSIALSIYAVVNFWKTKQINEYMFLFLLTSSLAFFLTFYLKINFSTIFSEHLVKFIIILPYFFIFSLIFAFHFLLQKIQKIPKIFLQALLIGAFLFFVYSINIADFQVTMDQKPAMNDNQYSVVKFVQQNTAPDSKILVLVKSFSFESFLLRKYADAFAMNITEINVRNYDYMIVPQDFAGPGQVVYQNPEIKIIKV